MPRLYDFCMAAIGDERMNVNRRSFLVQAGAASFNTRILATHALAADGVSAIDRERMRSVAAFTAETLSTDHPVPFGADIVSTATGERLMRAVNRVGPDHDPSAHAETLTIRLACAKLGSGSLKGYTLYTTCEPCAMCMACALWSDLDRLVFGATIADAGRFVSQIRIPAKEVARRTDLQCVVAGPVEREVCVKLFTDPRMQKTFAMWKKH
jgi:tRNA(Arg) A34 adenosine deaminase TadA